MVQVIDKLYLSSIIEARNEKFLKNCKITHVLIAAKSLQQYFDWPVYKRLNITDNPITVIANHFVEAFKFIDEARDQGKGILVHCLGGISRSVTIVIAYVMFSMNIGFEEAYLTVKKARKIANPNPGFVKQLRLFEKCVEEYHKNKSEEMVKGADYTLISDLIKENISFKKFGAVDKP